MIYHKRNMNNTFIDLYAGCGGMSLGMIEAGMKCIAAVEYDVWATQTYWTNLCWQGWSHLHVDTEERTERLLKPVKIKGETMQFTGETLNTMFPEPPDDYWMCAPHQSPTLNLFCCDILNLEPEEVMDICEFKPREIAAIVGGPPCQGFSTANSQRKIDDKRNEHPGRFLWFVKVMQPKFFIIENVPGILSLGKKRGEKEGMLPKWIRQLGKEYGYHVEYDIHDCATYGVPQHRRRVLFVGTRKDLYQEGVRFHLPEPTHTYSYFEKLKNPGLFGPPVDTEPFVNLIEAIGDLNEIDLPSPRESDAKKLPFGSEDRIGYDVYDFAGRHHYPDRFNGLYFMSHEFGRSMRENESAEHYMVCPECGKYNLKVRKQCHYCKKPFKLIIV